MALDQQQYRQDCQSCALLRGDRRVCVEKSIGTYMLGIFNKPRSYLVLLVLMRPEQRIF